MNAASKLELSNPKEAIDLAYTFHSADDETIAGTLDQELCKKEARLFIERTAKPGTPEEAYLRSIGPIIHTYCRALTRSKQHFNRKVAAADALLAADLERLDSGVISIRALVFGFKLLQPTVVFLGGLLLARVLGTVIPDSFTEKTGTGFLPTAVVVGIVLAVWQIVTQRLNHIERGRVYLRHQEAWFKAAIESEEYKLFHLKIVWANLLDAWKQYTGADFPRTVYYKAQMETLLVIYRGEYEKTLLKSRGIASRIKVLFEEIISAVTRRVQLLWKKRLPTETTLDI